jgi:hypothetical protein
MMAMSQPVFTRLRKCIDPRPDDRGRGSGQTACASNVILVMMLALLLGFAAFRFLQG